MPKDVVETIGPAPDWLVHELDKFFRNQEIAESVRAETRQRQIEKQLGQDRKSIDGLGQPIMELDEYVLAHWRTRLGHNPLKDSDWRKYMIKHFPEVRVQAIGTKEIHVGYGSKSSSARSKRFVKSYGNG